jgi:hypothetical protein
MAQGSMEECIRNCSGCHDTCLQTVTHCLQRGGALGEGEHVRLLLDCAEICRTSADLMLRGSDFHTAICAVCADVCTRCAEECERMSDSSKLSECAEACRRCAESCRAMLEREHRAA